MILLPLPQGQYRITQRFGERPEYYKIYGMNGHNGIDFAPFVPGALDQKIYAPHEGYVKVILDKGGYGKHVVITSLPYNKQGLCRQSTLAHFKEIDISDGMFVSAGDALGIMGTTGDSTGIHCHWTYRVLINDVVRDYGNGFRGAVDILPYALVWVKP